MIKRIAYFLTLSLFSITSLATELDKVETNKVVNIDVTNMPNTIEATPIRIELVYEEDEAIIYVFPENDIRLVRIDYNISDEELREINRAANSDALFDLKLELVEQSDKSFYRLVDYRILEGFNQLRTGFITDLNFSPIVAKSKREIQRLFNSVYSYDSEYYDVDDNCYNRATFWSRSHQVNRLNAGYTKDNGGTGTDKVFIFFSRSYINEFKHNWWYHVAPLVYLESEDNPWVFDSTFISRPVTLNQWLSTFDGHTKGNCTRIYNISEYHRNNHRPICMYAIASMFHYTPNDIGRNLTNWRCSDFYSLKRYSPPYSQNPNYVEKYNPDYTWDDFSYLFPQFCL